MPLINDRQIYLPLMKIQEKLRHIIWPINRGDLVHLRSGGGGLFFLVFLLVFGPFETFYTYPDVIIADNEP